MHRKQTRGTHRMQITIAQRLRPFSHLPGTTCPIPFSHWQVQVFPTLLKFKHLVTFEEREVPLPWKGPVLDFTVELDLEKGVVFVFGHTAEGYRKLVIEAPGKIDLPKSQERLSLGQHKALDWELVCRRRDLKEIFPIWFRLGQLVPEAGKKVGTAQLLQDYDKLEVCAAYLKLFMAGFSGLMAPRLSDDDHQGIVPEGKFSDSPLFLLTEGARYIRALFFKEWSFLPCLPPEFHSGRLVHLKTDEGDEIDFEWSKKLLRRAVIRPAATREIPFTFQKAINSFRYRKSLKEKGKRHPVHQPLILEKGQTVFLDRFEK